MLLGANKFRNAGQVCVRADPRFLVHGGRFYPEFVERLPTGLRQEHGRSATASEGPDTQDGPAGRLEEVAIHGNTSRYIVARCIGTHCRSLIQIKLKSESVRNLQDQSSSQSSQALPQAVDRYLENGLNGWLTQRIQALRNRLAVLARPFLIQIARLMPSCVSRAMILIVEPLLTGCHPSPFGLCATRIL